MSNKKIKRIFIPGEEWLYVKIYCGIKISDDILIYTIKPLTAAFLKVGLVDKWFFIRYLDPEEHLRIRLHLTCITNLNNIIEKLKNELLIYFKNHQVWDVEFSTYKRELERYGFTNMGNSESFFFLDSEYIVDNILKFEKDTDRFLNVLRYIENILSNFKIKGKVKLDFLNKMQLNFKEEFKTDKTTIIKLNKKYKELSGRLNKEPINNYIDFKKLVGNILTLSNTNKLEIPLENIIASYIHMTVNRSFSSNQRLYELMIYDFLYKTNNSKFARYGRL